jgi:hypothetical protein
MGTLTSKLVLTSTDLTSNALDLTTSTTFTGSHTSGLAREEIKSVSKTMRISCVDGDLAIADAGVHEGQYIDITDNHGLTKRYVIIDGSNSTVATGDIIASGTDLGSNTAANLGLLETVGGVAIDVQDTTTQSAFLTLLKAAIEHANGHNGSITVAAVSSKPKLAAVFDPRSVPDAIISPVATVELLPSIITYLFVRPWLSVMSIY